MNWQHVSKRLPVKLNVIFIDDGSSDRSIQVIEEIAASDKRFTAISLSRNFGHQAAISCGLDHAKGDAVITMDADLQDPPELIEEMIAKWMDGAEIVYAVRRERQSDSFFKRNSAILFYKVMSRLATINAPMNSADFRLLDRKALNAFLQLKESNRYIRGLISWIGYHQAEVYYDRPERFAGETKYSLTKMVKLAVDAMISFSNIPLRLCTCMGLIFSLVSTGYGTYIIGLKLSGIDSQLVIGWSSLAVLISFIGGTLMLMLGILGEYLIRVFDEVRRRPLYLINHHLEQNERGSNQLSG